MKENGIRLTIAYPYYDNKALIQNNMELWSTFPEDLRRECLFIVIDDGSREPLNLKPLVPMNLCVARIMKDIRWNQPGARNLALNLAPTEWCYLADLDHPLTISAYRKLQETTLCDDTVYFFRRRSNTGEDRGVHISSFCIHKLSYWKTGGFDEDFCGHYGYDDFLLYDIFKQQLKLHTFEEEFIICYDNFKSSALKRNARRNKFLIRKKRKQLQKDTYVNKQILRFPWRIVNWDVFK